MDLAARTRPSAEGMCSERLLVVVRRQTQKLLDSQMSQYDLSLFDDLGLPLSLLDAILKKEKLGLDFKVVVLVVQLQCV